MDKKTLSKICLVCVLTMAAGSAYAGSFSGTTINGTSGTFSTSSNVTIEVDSSVSNYAASSQHLQGDRAYFTNSQNPAFYYESKTKGTTVTVIGSSTMLTPTGFSTL